jgi:Domain of unknown function (DUF4440)
MKELMGVVLTGYVCALLVLVNPLRAISGDSGAAEALKQFEEDFGDAIEAADTNKLDQILDSDWTELGQTASILTKRELLADLAAGKYKLKPFEMGPMYVKDLGNLAVVQGSTTETSISKGTESSRRSGWMDVLLKRGDTWVVVRSQSATAK